MTPPLMLRVPPDGPRRITLSDRRSQRTWQVEVPVFEIAPTTVSAALWAEIMGTGAPAGEDGRLPVVEVSWRDAVVFCNRVSAALGLAEVYDVQEREIEPQGGWVPHDRPALDAWEVRVRGDADGFRLPTEAEWQLACQAGTSGPRYGALDEIAWYAGNSGDHPPGAAQKAANPWGLFDTLGGVWEWCWDLYDESMYGPYRVIRGGGWADPEWSCRAGVRRKTHPDARLDDLGFRLARNAT